MNTITIEGCFHDYCVGCPFLDLSVVAASVDGMRFYGCQNQVLCDNLYRYLSEHTTIEE